MNAVNAVQLFILVWTFTAVCQADKLADKFDFSVSCDDVTGFVMKDVTFTCNIPQQCTEYCFTKYKFQYPTIYNDSTICEHVLPEGSCEQRISFTCRYTPTTAMTEQFRFFLQTKCGMKMTSFTVGITDSLLIKTEDPVSKDIASKDSASKDSAIAAAVGCFSILLIIIIMMIIICKTKTNFIKPCGFQKRMFLRIKRDEDNSTPPEDVI